MLDCDAERKSLLEEEKQLLARTSTPAASTSETAGAAKNGSEDATGARLQEVYARLQEIDADGAPARAASILAGLSFDKDMQGRATKTFSGGEVPVLLAPAMIGDPTARLLNRVG